MEFKANTVLITGGGSGIGFALAERFIQAESSVIVCGRRKHKLKEAQSKYPQLHIRVCNVAKPAERTALFAWVTESFPGLNMLVNNAGIQQRIELQQRPSWETLGEEVAINLEAPIHLSTLFIPHLLKQERPAIINITSGLSFVPKANVPVYCATKSALHSFTLSLRHQLSGTPIDVIEIIPPAVDTDLGGKGLHTFGVPLNEFTDGIVKQLKMGSIEATYGFSAESSRASREQLEAIFKQMNQPL
ncbi:MAG: SDR family NAD(P)-dependent oxidoreductase [Deltaproteobacteria bacterium]|nr:SDR family NAD(P)-dependent oxidoreductase [Deltaproteobacteria bacterium]MBW1827308.1 SDR family NAD(P)-dependent oxidoreductase [Deltaproteobacteria bacterium]